MNNKIHLQVNNVICEGFGCFNKANTKVNVKVGQLGTIPLDLCTYCVKKFDEYAFYRDIEINEVSEFNSRKR